MTSRSLVLHRLGRLLRRLCNLTGLCFDLSGVVFDDTELTAELHYGRD